MLSPTDSSLAGSYNNIGLEYKNMGEYPRALSYYHKGLTIAEKTLHENHPSLVTAYNNRGLLYKSMGEYSQASSYHNKVLPANHPDSANMYHNMGVICCRSGEYSKAKIYFEKAFDIRKRSLPPGHPCIKTSQTCLAEIDKKLQQ